MIGVNESSGFEFSAHARRLCQSEEAMIAIINERILFVVLRIYALVSPIKELVHQIGVELLGYS